MRTQDVYGAYMVLQGARLGKMETGEKVGLIRALRAMKPVAVGFEEARNDAMAAAREEGHDGLVEAFRKWKDGSGSEAEGRAAERYLSEYARTVNAAVADLAAREVEPGWEPLSADALMHLFDGNDWTAAEMLAVEDVLGE